MLASEKPWWKPGTRSGYQSITFSFLVGELVKRVLKKSRDPSETIGNFFRKEVAEPLNIDFHIGIDKNHDNRVAELIDSHGTVPKWLFKMLKVFKPRTAKVFFNPPPNELMKHCQTREWRAAEASFIKWTWKCAFNCQSRSNISLWWDIGSPSIFVKIDH